MIAIVVLSFIALCIALGSTLRPRALRVARPGNAGFSSSPAEASDPFFYPFGDIPNLPSDARTHS
jgi:hypothetical protein